MKIYGKMAACILALLMVLPLTLSCHREKEPEESGGTSAGDMTEPLPTTETDQYGQQVIDDGIPDTLNYGGAEIRILIRDGQAYSREWTNEDTSSTLNQKIHFRNLAVQEQLGVKLKFIPQSQGAECQDFNNRIIASGKAGGELDIVSNYAAYAGGAALLSEYLNFYSKELTYIDLSKPYWNQNFIKSADTHGRLFLCVGDANLSVFDRTFVVYFNKQLVENDAKIGDLYQMVYDGTWTVDEFYRLTKDIYAADGEDGTFGITVAHGSESCDGWLYAFGANITKTQVDGTHVLITSATDANQWMHLENAREKASGILFSTGTRRFGTNEGGTGASDNLFIGGKAYFAVRTFYRDDASNSRMPHLKNIRQNPKMRRLS